MSHLDILMPLTWTLEIIKEVLIEYIVFVFHRKTREKGNTKTDFNVNFSCLLCICVITCELYCKYDIFHLYFLMHETKQGSW